MKLPFIDLLALTLIPNKCVRINANHAIIIVYSINKINSMKNF